MIRNITSGSSYIVSFIVTATFNLQLQICSHFATRAGNWLVWFHCFGCDISCGTNRVELLNACSFLRLHLYIWSLLRNNLHRVCAWPVVCLPNLHYYCFAVQLDSLWCVETLDFSSYRCFNISSRPIAVFVYDIWYAQSTPYIHWCRPCTVLNRAQPTRVHKATNAVEQATAHVLWCVFELVPVTKSRFQLA